MLIDKAMLNWNFVKRQLNFDKPRYLFTKTHKPKTKTQMFYEKKQLIIYILNGKKHYYNMKQLSELLILTTVSMT